MENLDTKRVKKLLDKVIKVTSKIEDTNGNTISQKIIMAAFDMMTISQLEDINYLLINKIKLKKIAKSKYNGNKPSVG